MTDTNKQQNRLIFLCWFLYVCAYLGRYSYSANINLIINEYGVSHSDAGLVSTFFFFSYGIGQVIHGFLCKKYSQRWLFPLCALLSSGINLLFALGVPFGMIKYLWLINGFCQSCFWPTLIYILSEHLDDNHLQRAVLVMSTTISVGMLTAYASSAFFAQWGTYRYSALGGCLVLLAAGLVWAVFFRPVHARQSAVSPLTSEPSVSPAQKRKLSAPTLLVILLLGIFAVIVNLVKDGLHTWVPTYLKESFSLSDSLSISLTVVLPLLGVCGSLIANALRRRIRDFGIIEILLMLSIAVLLGIFFWAQQVTYWLVLGVFGLIILMAYGCNNIITSMAPLFLREEVNSGTLAGILDGLCYVGSAISSFGLGLVADKGGWNGVFTLLFEIVLVAVGIGVFYLLARKIMKKKTL